MYAFPPISSETRPLRLAGVAAGVLVASAAGAQDLNGNDIVDHAERRSGTINDCNTNGISDLVDIERPHQRVSIEHLVTNGEVEDVAILDFDQDGDNDVVAVTRDGPNNGRISLWKQVEGDSNLGMLGGVGLVFVGETFLANATCSFVEAADVNSDGRPDLIIGDPGFGQLVVMLADGDASFAAPDTYPSTRCGYGLALADFDQDGDIDVASACGNRGEVEIFWNNGSGQFPQMSAFATGLDSADVAAADINGDGFTDLVVANSNWTQTQPFGPGDVSVLLNAGGQSFTTLGNLTVPGDAATDNWSRPLRVALGDLDGDNDPDMAVSSDRSQTLGFFENDGSGQFTFIRNELPGGDLGGEALAVEILDLNQDGTNEVLWTDTDGHAIRIYATNAGIPGFEMVRAYAASSYGPVNLAAGDISSDGRLDIVTADDVHNTFTVMPAYGDLQFHATRYYKRQNSSLDPFLLDLTGDGKTDLVSYASLGTVIKVMPGLGVTDEPDFGPAFDIDMGVTGDIHPRDVDNDGDPDIINVVGNLTVSLNLGNGNFSPPIDSNISALRNSCFHDINNDGLVDVSWLSRSSSAFPNDIGIAFNNGDGSFTGIEFEGVGFQRNIWYGDITGDGAPEMFVGASGNHIQTTFSTFYLAINDGAGNFGPLTPISFQLFPDRAFETHNFVIRDFDNDGDNDVTFASGYTWIMYNDGAGNLSDPIVATMYGGAMTTPLGRAVVDYDHDGDLDLLSSGFLGGSSFPAPRVLFNNGKGIFDEYMTLQSFRNNFDHFAFGDADNNGWTDIITRPEGFLDWYLHLSDEPASRDDNANGIPDECETSGQDCLPDTNGDGALTPADFTAWIDAFNNDLPACDQNADGSCDPADFSAWINNFNAGCGS